MIEVNDSKVTSSIRAALGKIEILTKRLKVMSIGKNTDKRKVVVSSRDLIVSGMPEGTKIVVEAQGHSIKVRRAEIGDSNTRVISSRKYANRNWVEPVLDIRHQQLIDRTINTAKQVHVVFKREEIIINPVVSFAEQAKQSDTGLVIDINQKDSDGLYSGVVKAIRVIKKNMFSQITVETDSEFCNSHEFTLFTIQLRRLGHEISLCENGFVKAEIAGANKPTNIERIDIGLPNGLNKERRQLVNSHFSANNVLSAFTVCTSGVDVSAIEADGFMNTVALDYRPHEKRDHKKSKCSKTGEITTTLNDKSDSGALCVAINSKHLKVLLNENIHDFKMSFVSEHVEHCNFMQISLLCDDFSSLKNKNDREKSIEKLDTTRDTFFDVLDTIEASYSNTIMVENVKNFASSVECKLFQIGLNELGYVVKQQVLNALDYNGMTNRQRSYTFASTLEGADEFEFPCVEERKVHAWNDVISNNLDSLRDVSHTVSVKKGIETGRIRTIEVGDSYTPTFTRSQSRQTKDSVYVVIDGKYYLPSNELVMELMGFVDGFDISCFTSEMGSEIIGQSIEVPLHRKIGLKVKDFITGYAEKFHNCSTSVCNEVKQVVDTVKDRTGQLAFSF